jgi:hypothetical protein
MKKLSKEKRQQLILIALAAVGIMGGLWYFLIGAQREKQAEVASKIAAVQSEVNKMAKVKRDAGQVEASLNESTAKLDAIETTMPSGDVYSLLVRRLKQFNAPSYRVDIPQFGLPVLGEVPVLPDFPYHQASVTVVGTAFYWDLGRFISDFENQFPYSRIQNLSLDPGGAGANPDDREKLTFHMEIVTLVKPT